MPVVSAWYTSFDGLLQQYLCFVDIYLLWEQAISMDDVFLVLVSYFRGVYGHK